jgi:hypothetical protein
MLIFKGVQVENVAEDIQKVLKQRIKIIININK